LAYLQRAGTNERGEDDKKEGLKERKEGERGEKEDRK